jgi:succinate-semialdehyde dehydrogenase/glutarate-semialdehyde dehydrogenase
MQRALKSVDPSSGNVIKTYKALSAAELDKRLRRSREAFSDWSRHPLAERAAGVRALGTQLREKKRELAAMACAEMGKPLAEAEAEVEKCAWVCDWFAEHGGALLQPRPVATQATRSYVRFDPLGPILAVMPWNFPYWQIVRFGAAALLAGDTVLVKHAPNTCGCALLIEEVARAARLPEGAVQTLLVPESAVDGILADPGVAAVTLTGSDGAGRAVAQIAAKYLKKSVLELGGADAFIVLDDADLDLASEQAVRSRCQNSGQSCIAAKRFIVQKGVADGFEKRVVERMKKLVVGDPRKKGTQVGPLAREDLRATLHLQVQRSVEQGARLLAGGQPRPGPGFFYLPTVLGGVGPGMPAWDGELFGPVMALAVADDEDRAVAMANDSRYGLAASVWTADKARGEGLASRIEAGAVFVNRMPMSDPRLPFGGIKDSGWGRELGELGILEFVNIKSVWVE